MSKYYNVKIAIIALAILAVAIPAFAVTNPSNGTSTPNGRLIFVIDQNTSRIRVIDTDYIDHEVDITGEAVLSNPNQAAVVQDVPVAGGKPTSMTVSKDGTKLFVLVYSGSSSGTSYVNAYQISYVAGSLPSPTLDKGNISLISSYPLPSAGAAPMGCALSAADNYLYVTDMKKYPPGKYRVRVIDVSNTSSMSQSNMVEIVAPVLPLFGAAVSPDGRRLYISAFDGTTGQVLVYDITSPSSPSYVTALPSCPWASAIRVSNDNTRVFVRVHEYVSPFSDVRVFYTASGNSYSLEKNIIIPTPGNHVFSGTYGVDGMGNPTGYDVNLGNRDEDSRNMDDSLDISPDGRTLYFSHYRGVSGDGLWHWNLKYYAATLDFTDPAWGTSVYEANSGRGFSCTDSTVFSKRNRLFSLYSGSGDITSKGGYLQSTLMFGPSWVGHHSVTSNEVTVNWAAVEYAASFEVFVKRVTPTAVLTTIEVVTATNEYRIPFTYGLSQMTTYEVRVRCWDPRKEGGEWQPNHYVLTGEAFYTLETLWLDHFNDATTETTIVFGPVISRGTPKVKNVPYAVRYDLVWRPYNASNAPTFWPSYVSVPITADVNSAGDLIQKINLTTPNISYEARMRSVDSTGGVSEWSTLTTFESKPTPWIAAYKVRKDSAYLEWGWPNKVKNYPGVVSYTLNYRLNPGTPGVWIPYSITIPATTEDDAVRGNLNIFFIGNTPPGFLTGHTTYEVRIQGNYADSSTSGWSNTYKFFTAPSPSYAYHYHVVSNEAWLASEGISEDATLSYEFQTREAGGTWVTAKTMLASAREDLTNINIYDPNYKQFGIKPSTTYEVRARTVSVEGTNTFYSDWTPLDNFYTLEKCWLDWYVGSDNKIYLTWGPAFSKGINVFGAVDYVYRYRVNGGAWTVSPEALLPTYKKDPSKQNATDPLSFRLFPLQASSTYEIQIAARDSIGMLSDWSTTNAWKDGNSVTPTDGIIIITDPMLRLPWINSFGTTPESTAINWGWITGEPASTHHYEMIYSTNEGDSWQDYSGVAAPLTDSTSFNSKARTFLFNGLIPLTTYEARIRAFSDATNTIGNQSSVYTFHTFWQMWTDHFKVGTKEAYVMWGPQVATAELSHYDLQWRNTATTEWTDYTAVVLTNATSNGTSELDGIPNIFLTGLTQNQTYEVRTRAIHVSGFPGDWSTPDMFRTVPMPFWLDVKNIGTNEATLIWDNRPASQYGAISYEVSYGTDEAATNEVTAPIFVTATSEKRLYNPPLVTNGVYYAKVRSIYAAGVISDWSDIISFEVTPTLSWVSHYLVASHEAVIDWAGVAGALSYDIKFKRAIDADIPANWTTLTGVSTTAVSTDPNPSYRINTGLIEKTTYEVTVRAIKPSGTTKWATPDKFYTLESPWLSTYNASDETVNVVWGPQVTTTTIEVPLADHFDVYFRINKTGAFQKYTLQSFFNSSRSGTNAKPSQLLSPLTQHVTYEFMMRTVDDTGGVSDWSSTVECHTIKGPWWLNFRDILSNRFTGYWEPCNGVTGYEFIYTKEATMANPTLITTGSTVTQATTPANLQAYTWYYAQVRSTNSFGRSDWSSVEAVFTMDRPEWISDFVTTTNTTSLTWEPAVGTYEVKYTVGTDPTVNYWPMPATMESSNYLLGVGGLTGRTWYHTNVRSKYLGYDSMWSDVHDFYTIPVPGNVEIVSADATHVYISWEPVYVASGVLCTSYEVSYSLTSDAFTTNFTIAPAGANNYLALSLPTSIPYYVRVRAVDVNGATLGWSNWEPYDGLFAMATDEAIISDTKPNSGATVFRGSTIKLIGYNFGTSAEAGTITMGGVPVEVGYWTNKEIAFTVPPKAAAGSTIVNVVKANGKPARPLPTYIVATNTFVLDDFEGGAWQYVTWEASGGANAIAISRSFVAPVPERESYLSVEALGTCGTVELVGGISPYGNLPTEEGYNLRPYNVIKFWIKGDGVGTYPATFELVESNTAAGNHTYNEKDTGVYGYKTPIMITGGSWTQVTIVLTQDAFQMLPEWYPLVYDYGLSFEAIKAYQIQTGGNTPKKYYIDHMYATYEVLTIGVLTNETITRLGDTPGSGISLSWAFTGAPTAVDVWVKTGTFETGTANWTKQFTTSVGATSWTDPLVTVGDGNIKWYKLVPAGGSFSSTLLSTDVLGKFDILLNKGASLISLPFIPADLDINKVIGNQLTGGSPFGGTPDTIQTNVNGTLLSSYLNGSGIWNTAQISTMEPDRGYFININYANVAKTITLAGKTTPTRRTVDLIGGTGTFNYVGSCYPLNISLNSSDLAGLLAGAAPFSSTADTVQENFNGVINTAYKDLSSGQFKSLTLKDFMPGKGYMVVKNASGNATWYYPTVKPY
jgi:hypothetical protein